MKRIGGRALVLDRGRESLISSGGAVLVTRTMDLGGTGRVFSQALAPWRGRGAIHDPGKVLLDLATAVALGGDCAADVAAIRAQPDLFGAVASAPTISRLIATLAADIETSLPAIRAARAQARARIWARRRPLAGVPGTRNGGQVIVDIDATLIDAHSDKEGASGTRKRGYGFHPMMAFLDHGPEGTGEVLVGHLRGGSAAAFTATDHIAVIDAALEQLPPAERGQVLVRTDGGGCSKQFMAHLVGLGLEYSVGFRASGPVQDALDALPIQAWKAALNPDGTARRDAQVAELTHLLPTHTRSGEPDWPPGMRVIARRELPAPNAQLRLTDRDGWRITLFATNTPRPRPGTGPGWHLADLELRHRQRGRCEDRIRTLKDTGLRNLPFHGFAHNQIWLEIIALAADLLTWTQTLAFSDHPARRWEPKRLRFRILNTAARIIRTGRQHRLRLPLGWPWNDLIDHGWAALRTA